jgi:hypothetical protein
VGPGKLLVRRLGGGGMRKELEGARLAVKPKQEVEHLGSEAALGDNFVEADIQSHLKQLAQFGAGEGRQDGGLQLCDVLTCPLHGSIISEQVF